MFEKRKEAGYDVEFTSHAEAILSHDLPGAAGELEAALLATTIPVEEIIAGGGGESKGTQRLRRALAGIGWRKTIFEVTKSINGKPRESQSHEVDHVKTFDGATIALEIEWNNKDPFYDRDLENFKRLHADGAISVGCVITRGKSLHAEMRDIVRRFTVERGIDSIEALSRWGYTPTARQKTAIMKRVTRAENPMAFGEAFVSVFTPDKFGEATTHWIKLEARLKRGVGNPCPLLLIGLPASIVSFGEGASALREVLAEPDDSEEPTPAF